MLLHHNIPAVLVGDTRLGHLVVTQKVEVVAADILEGEGAVDMRRRVLGVVAILVEAEEVAADMHRRVLAVVAILVEAEEVAADMHRRILAVDMRRKVLVDILEVADILVEIEAAKLQR